jgi:predicted transcriptional regulator
MFQTMRGRPFLRKVSTKPKYSEDAEQGSNGSEPNYFIGLGGGILAALFLGSGVFEVLKIAVLMALFTPLISKKSRNDELNRGRILGFIEGNAGIHFSALRDGLQLANGVTAYHLQMLETQNEIISWRDGKLRRYAAAHLSVEQRAAVAHPVIGTRLAILETLSRAGQLGLSNAQIAEQLQLSRQLLSYHIKSLSDESFIEKVLPKRRSPWALTTNGQEILVQRNTA